MQNFQNDINQAQPAFAPRTSDPPLYRFEAQLERSDERLSRIAEQQESLRERLTRDLVAAERRVAASQSTLTFLRQQVDIWSADN